MTRSVRTGVTLAAIALVAGCGGQTEEPAAAPAATVTETRTATVTATPEPTPTEAAATDGSLAVGKRWSGEFTTSAVLD